MLINLDLLSSYANYYCLKTNKIIFSRYHSLVSNIWNLDKNPELRNEVFCELERKFEMKLLKSPYILFIKYPKVPLLFTVYFLILEMKLMRPFIWILKPQQKQ